jgi:hypothetical protein
MIPVPKQLIFPVANMMVASMITPLSIPVVILVIGTKTTLSVESMIPKPSMLPNFVALVAEVVHLLLVTTNPISQPHIAYLS